MRSLLPILIAALLAAPAQAGGRRRAAVSAPRPEITIAFVGVTAGGGSEGLIEAGRMSHVQRRAFGIRIDGPGTAATLRASLETADGRCTVRVDGIELGAVPKVIAARTPLGGVTNHTLEIVVPPSVPEGSFAASVRWEASNE